jgi:hypothetical protein
MLQISERRKLRIIYRPINDNGIWRARYGSGLYMACGKLDIVKVIKTGR